MSYKNGNYAAFYVAEPVSESNLAANATKDYIYYNMLKMWKASDEDFAFVDSHEKNYNVREGSDWDLTLKPRLHQRLLNSKNIILFISSNTKESKTLKEEIEYGVGKLGLPVIVVYPDIKYINEMIDENGLKKSISDLWDKLPTFKKYINKVPSIHIPLDKFQINKALRNKKFTVSGAEDVGPFYYER